MGYARRIQDVLEVTQVVNIIEQGVTFPARYVLSGGLEAVVKYQRNPAWTDVLINEWIGNSIADLTGLSIPRYGICNLSRDVIEAFGEEELDARRAGSYQSNRQRQCS